MPSKPVVKPAHDSVYNDDPLAELSRIMGLNEEARQQVEQDDFGIDLEQELLGELAAPEEQADATPLIDAQAEEDPFGDALAAEIDGAFEDFSVDEQGYDEPEVVADAPFEAFAPAEVGPGETAASDDDIFDDADFAAFDAALEDAGTAPSAEMSDADASAAPVQADTGLEDELLALLSESARQQQVVADPQPVDAFESETTTEAGDVETVDDLGDVFGEADFALDETTPVEAVAHDTAEEQVLGAEGDVFETVEASGDQGAWQGEAASEVTAYAEDEPADVDFDAAEIFDPAAEPVAYEAGEVAGYDAGEPAAEIDPAGEQPAMVGELEEPMLDASDFAGLEDEFAVPADAADLEAPADDDVEAFAAEPGEWLAGDPVEEAPFNMAAETADPLEVADPQAEWQPAEPLSDGYETAETGEFEQDYAPESDAALYPAAVTDAYAADAEWTDEPAAEAAPFVEEPAASALDDGEADLPDFDLPDDFADAELSDLDVEADDQLAAPEPAAPQEAAPQPSAQDDDPFATLAAMAAAPPILKTFGRATPIAVNATAARPGVAQPSAQAAPEPVSPRQSAPAPESYFSLPRREREAEQAVRPATPTVTPSAAGSTVAAAGMAAAQPHAFSPRPATNVRPAPEAPEVETVEVAESQVPVADDFDIPELPAYEPAPAASSGYDEFDDEFVDAFQQLTQPAPAPAPSWRAAERAPAQQVQAQPHDDGFESALEADLARVDMASAEFATYGEDDEAELRRARNTDLDDDYAAAASHNAYADDDAYAVGEGFAGDAEAERTEPARRGLLIAAIVAGVAIAGGLGAFALSFGGDDTPALVRADPDPVKVKPENPGGTVVANQEGKVYERVAGAQPATPEQETLVTSVEEPIEPVVQGADPVPLQGDAEALPGVDPLQIKSEERVIPEATVAAEASGNEVAAVAPRKVRTMIVRPDGTLVPREDPAPAAEPTGSTPAAAQPAIPQVASAAEGAGDDVTILPAGSQAVTAPTAAESAPAGANTVVAPAPRPSRSATAEAPAAPERQAPARAEPTQQVAAAPAQPAPAPTEQAAAPAGDLWQVQIASQPTQEGAQASYEDLARRYGSVLGGKPVNIVQAEIPNKGTFWRVRIPAASKSDANILCAKLKTAGGSCFVSK